MLVTAAKAVSDSHELCFGSQPVTKLPDKALTLAACPEQLLVSVATPVYLLST